MIGNVAVAKIGEFGLIEAVKKMIKLDRTVIKGIGDDTAVLSFSKNRCLLLTSDMLIEDIHFNRRMNPFAIGHKALSCSISDIAAMGGIPKNAIISIGIPRDLKISFVNKLYQGITQTAKSFKINIVGGDTNSSQKIVIDVALLGEAQKNNLTLRSKAKVGDSIFVTGKLGGSLKSGKHLSFLPRLKESRKLVSNYKINSMIDISDGLIQDLSHILKESNKGAIIYERNIPINKNSSLNNALYDGEDFELLFTLPEKDAFRLKNDIAKGKIKFYLSEIGKITNNKNKIEIINKKGFKRPLTIKGFRHF